MGLSEFASAYNAHRRERDAEVQKLNDAIEKRHQQIQRLEKKKEKISSDCPNWIEEVIRPLALEISAKLNQYCDVKGPFGIRAEAIIYIVEDPDVSILDQGSRSITITPNWNEDGDMDFWYDTGEETDNFEKGTIGFLNGMNNITALLPDSVDDIIKLLKWNEPLGRFNK